MARLDMATSDRDGVLVSLRRALDEQRRYLEAHERPSGAVAYETLRTLDDLFCRDLMEPTRAVDQIERRFRDLSTWGVNHALRRVIPRSPDSRPFREFPSSHINQAKADDFLFNCGALQLAEHYEGLLREGVLTGELRRYPNLERGLNHVVVLRSAVPSDSDEEIGMAGLSWASNQVWSEDRGRELELERRHRDLERHLHCRVDLVDGWRAVYSATPEIDQHFLEWGRLYLRRIFSQDLIGADDIIGGRPFSQYVEVLSALSGRSQKHIAFAAILRARYPSVHIRNLLTAHESRDVLIRSIARSQDSNEAEVREILKSLVLSGENLDAHTSGGDQTWAPIVEASDQTFLLPVYGLEINPFLFLLTELRHLYEDDWFRIANNRERRWIAEIDRLFVGSRWQTRCANLRLRDAGRDVTDIDFAVLDRKSNELALMQLKWQHPVGIDSRGRRSAGRNLVGESNRWIRSVTSWIDKHGVDELVRRLGFDTSCSPRVKLIVLGRYHAYLTGFDARDPRAIWSDWAHFRRVCVENPSHSVSELIGTLHDSLGRAKDAKIGESRMFPIGNVAVVINPKSVPDAV